MPLAKRRNLYVIPYAGGTATAFRTLPESLGQAVKFFPLELPGRGLRIAASLLDRVEAMVDDLAEQIDASPESGGYFLFGHTMGARLAYLVACRLRDQGKPEPLHLVLGGEGPPEVCPWRSEAADLARDDRFLAEVIGSGAHPEELLRTPQQKERLLPLLRADMAAFDNFDPPNPPKLTCSITAVIATRDIVRREEAERWARRTTGAFDVKMVTGSHFFFLRYMQVLGKALYESTRAYD